MNKQDYILQRKANGDTRTVDELTKEYNRLQAEMQPKQKPTDIVSEHIAPQLKIAERERADGLKQTGVFNTDGSLTWGDWT